jgi:ribose transport system substrate-binding protein
MRLAIFTKNTVNPAYAAARAGAERTARRLGADVSHYVPQKPDDVDQQIALVDEALAAEPDAFVFVPVHRTAINDAIMRVFAAGIPVVNFLNRLSIEGAITFVGCDDYRLAQQMLHYLASHIGGRGNIVLIEGAQSAVTSVDRMRGFRDALKAYPGIKVLATLKGEYLEAPAASAVQAFLDTLNGPLDAVVAANDSMALGAIQALAARGIRVPVTGVNAIPEAIDAIRRGELLATADFDAMKISCVATEAAIRHLRGEGLPREIILPVQVVDRRNCAAWEGPLEARACPEWGDVLR